MVKYKQLEDRDWLEAKLKDMPMRHIAQEIGCSYSGVHWAVKKFNLIIPERNSYVYTPESRKAKSETIKAVLKARYPNGRHGELASNWRGGAKLCMDCGTGIKRKDAVRCDNCNGIYRRGKNNTNWRGGISPENMKVRSSKEIKIWRKAVFERDDYTCVFCGARSGQGKTVILHADHIKSFSEYPELRFAIDNGRTLCIDCHKKTDTYAGKMNKGKKYKV